MSKIVDRVLLGDNPFFGVDHLSLERARERAALAKRFERIVQVIEVANRMGVKGFVVSTHPELRDMLNYIDQQPELEQKVRYYPIVPYVQEYVSRATQKGMINAVIDILKPLGTASKIEIALR